MRINRQAMLQHARSAPNDRSGHDALYVHVSRSVDKSSQPQSPRVLSADEIVRAKEKERSRLASAAGLSGRPGPSKSSRLDASALLDFASRRTPARPGVPPILPPQASALGRPKAHCVRHHRPITLLCTKEFDCARCGQQDIVITSSVHHHAPCKSHDYAEMQPLLVRLLDGLKVMSGEQARNSSATLPQRLQGSSSHQQQLSWQPQDQPQPQHQQTHMLHPGTHSQGHLSASNRTAVPLDRAQEGQQPGQPQQVVHALPQQPQRQQEVRALRATVPWVRPQPVAQAPKPAAVESEETAAQRMRNKQQVLSPPLNSRS